MKKSKLAYPLHRPWQWKRTKRPERARFKGSFAENRDFLIGEVHRLGGRDLVISTNIRLKKDGYPYGTQKKLDDEGVAVYFTLKGDDIVMACDKFDCIAANIKAIAKTIEAMRGIERWGSSEMLQKAFTGYKALPAGGTTQETGWWTVLGVPRDASSTEVDAAYRQKVKAAHPDSGGTSEEFQAVREAFNLYQKEICR